MATPMTATPSVSNSRISQHLLPSILGSLDRTFLAACAESANPAASTFEDSISDPTMIEFPGVSPDRTFSAMSGIFNHAPALYSDFLLQFPEKKLKAMQKAFLAGSDLTPFVDERVVSSFVWGTPNGRFPAHNEILASMTTAVCWGLAAPDILKGGAKARTSSSIVAEADTRRRRYPAASENSPSNPFHSVLQGESCDLVGWMKGWKGSPEHQEMIKTAIRTSPEELASNKHGVSVLGYAEFGLKRVGWSSTDVPVIPFNRPIQHFYRTLVVSNESSEAVVLLDVCGIPSISQTFIFHDDYGLAHHYGCEENQQIIPGENASPSVTLQAGAKYQVTVELKCSEEDVAWHQQWLLFIFGSGNPLYKNHQEIFVIGRCVSALIGQNIQDVQKCLSTEAKPFYPAALRCLFDKQPLSYEVADSTRNLRDWRSQVPAFCQTHLTSVWPQQLYYLEEALYTGVHSPDSYISTKRCVCTTEQLRQLSHLLALEEASMEWDIKEYDLFNVQLSHFESSNFLLEVPGLPENRPSVFVGDLVYIRLERYSQMECAAEVVALEFRPTPQLILKIPPAFMKHFPLPPAAVLVHARFTFDRLFLTRMHSALAEVAVSPACLLPCICSLGKSSSPMSPSVKVDEKSSASQTRVRINKSLNEEQWKAVTDVVDRVHGPGPYIILGPPGTGKTVTMVECVLQLLSTHPSARLCVCAPSNYAADILCSGIAAGGIGPSLMWRMNDPRRTMASIKVDILKFCNFGLQSRASEEKMNFKVIVCTCGAAGMLCEQPLSARWEALTHVLIDEAGQALIPESLIPLSLGNSNTSYILCGDPKQLGPVVHSKLAAENGLDDTLIARFQRAEEGSSGSGRTGNSRVTKLVRNYRANEKLLELPSRLFYNNELIASAQASTVIPPKDWEELKGRDFPMLFYGVRGQQLREGESPSYFNAVEAGKVVDLISGLISKTQIVAGDIGVMAPYRRQVQKLRLILRSRNLGSVRVGTVDDYQGQEEKVVFISTVLTRPDSLKQVTAMGQNRHIGFLSNAKRFNVAISRAKAMLVVVGHPLVLSLDENWRELLRYCLAKDAFRGYGSEVVSPLGPPEFSTEHSTLDDNTSEFGWEDEDEKKALEALETAKAIEKLAELSLLGMGDKDRLYPVDLDSMYSAFTEDLEWRIQL